MFPNSPQNLHVSLKGGIVVSVVILICLLAIGFYRMSIGAQMRGTNFSAPPVALTPQHEAQIRVGVLDQLRRLRGSASNLLAPPQQGAFISALNWVEESGIGPGGCGGTPVSTDSYWIILPKERQTPEVFLALAVGEVFTPYFQRGLLGNEGLNSLSEMGLIPCDEAIQYFENAGFSAYINLDAGGERLQVYVKGGLLPGQQHSSILVSYVLMNKRFVPLPEFADEQVPDSLLSNSWTEIFNGAKK